MENARDTGCHLRGITRYYLKFESFSKSGEKRKAVEGSKFKMSLPFDSPLRFPFVSPSFPLLHSFQAPGRAEQHKQASQFLPGQNEYVTVRDVNTSSDRG